MVSTDLGKHVLTDLNVETLSVNTQTPWGHQCFQDQLRQPTSDVALLRRRQLPLLALRHRDVAATSQILRDQLKDRVVPAAEHLKDSIEPLDPRIAETIQQIFWSPDSMGAFLNTSSYLVTALVIWKTLIIPGISVLAPLLAIIVPFFVLRFIHDTPIPLSTYISHVRTTLLRQVTIPPVLRAKHAGDTLGWVMETAFLLLTGGTFIGGIWNQITASLHLRSIVENMKRRGKAILEAVGFAETALATLSKLPIRFQRALRHLLAEGERALQPLLGMPMQPLAAYGYAWNDPQPLRALLTWIGSLDVHLAIAGLPNICFPRFSTTVTPLVLEGVHHPHLAKGDGKQVYNSADFAVPHVLLTGPNRGGKSTFCRAVGLAILCGQTWGFAWATRMSFAPFTDIVTALHPTDVLGKLSLFESEIEFARDVLERCRQERGRVFVMMDEIFHSTNAHDGMSATRVFLRQLYACSDTTSMISTHYRELVSECMESSEFKGVLQALAMDAVWKEDYMTYTYKVVPGISDKSSVMEILKERGLLVAVAAAEKAPETLHVP